MADDQLEKAIRQMMQQASPQSDGGLTDAQLLDRYATQRDESAFENLLWRHGPMVLRTCQRVLRHVHDANDAFQATFLILCRHAGSIRQRDSLASWLYRVAYRVALRARARAARRLSVEAAAPPPPSPSPEHAVEPDLRPMLDEELNRLPEKYRAPVVLCYLEGKTKERAALELGWPSGTVSGRLARAKDLLRSRLTRRGVGLSSVALAGVLAQQSGAYAVAPSLVHATARAVFWLAAGKSAAAAGISPAVALLAEQVMQSMAIARVALGGVGLLLGGLVIAAVATFLQPTEEPLPEHAVARIKPPRDWHAATVRHVAFSPDGRVVATADTGGTIRLRDTKTGEMYATLEHREWGVESLAVSPDGKSLAYVTGMRRLGVFNAEPQSGFYNWEVPTDEPPTALVFNPRGKLLVAGDRRGTIRLWEVSTGRELNQLETWTGAPIAAIACSPDDKYLLVHSPQGADVQRLLKMTGDPLPPLLQAPAGLEQLLVADDGRFVLGTSPTAAPRKWDTMNGQPLRDFLPDDGPAGTVAAALRADGRLVVTADANRTIRVWDAGDGSLLHQWSSPGPDLKGLAFTADDRIISVAADQTLLVWQIPSS